MLCCRRLTPVQLFFRSLKEKPPPHVAASPATPLVPQVNKHQSCVVRTRHGATYPTTTAAVEFTRNGSGIHQRERNLNIKNKKRTFERRNHELILEQKQSTSETASYWLPTTLRKTLGDFSVAKKKRDQATYTHGRMGLRPSLRLGDFFLFFVFCFP